MKFAFLGYGQEHFAAMSKSEQEAMLEDCFTYDRKLLKDGHMMDDGTALKPGPTGRILRWQKGAVVVTDGPFIETKEQLGGIGVLEARDMDHAVELMAKHPGLQYGATFEIRPINEESNKLKEAYLAKWRGTAPAPDARCVKFASMGYIDEAGFASKSKSEFDEMIKQCVAFDEERVKRGQWLSAVALQSAHAAKTLRAKSGRVTITDGPFAETKEHLGGIIVLALKDLDDAIDLLSRHPALAFGVVLEIRPIDEEINKAWEAQLERVKSAKS